VIKSFRSASFKALPGYARESNRRLPFCASKTESNEGLIE
jgi:hypothetical protein